MSQDHRTRVGNERRQKMRMRLIESALTVFAEKGVDASIIDDVIVAAGVSRGTFYNYFRTNTELLVAVSEALSNEIIHMIESVVGDFSNPVERLACGLRKFMHTVIAHPLFARFIWRAGFHAYSSSHLMMQYLPRHITESMQQGSFKVPDSLFALEFIAGVMLSATFAVSTHPVGEHYAEQVVQHILMGLGVSETEAHALANLAMPAFAQPNDSLLIRAQQKYAEKSAFQF